MTCTRSTSVVMVAMVAMVAGRSGPVPPACWEPAVPVDGWMPLIAVHVGRNVLLKSNGSHGNPYAHAQREHALRVLGRVAMRAAIDAHVAAPLADGERVDLLCLIGLPRRVARFDPPNLYPTVKPLVDGFTDAGCWPDDDSTVIRRTAFGHDPDPTGRKGLWRFSFHVWPAPDSTR